MIGESMENKTAKLLSGVAYFIWIVGGIGSLIASLSISSAFKYTLFESLGNSVSLMVFLTSAFSVFSTGLLFYGLSAVLNLLEKKIPNAPEPIEAEEKLEQALKTDEGMLLSQIYDEDTISTLRLGKRFKDHPLTYLPRLKENTWICTCGLENTKDKLVCDCGITYENNVLLTNFGRVSEVVSLIKLKNLNK